MKLTWTVLKGELRLSAELLLTLSSSALFGFIFRACLEREKESRDRWQKIPCVHLCMETQAESSLSLIPAHPDTVQPFIIPPLGSGDPPPFAFSEALKGREWHHSSHFTEGQVEAGCQNPVPSWWRHKWEMSLSLAAVVSLVHHSNNWHLLPLQKTSVSQTQGLPCNF